MNTTSAHSGVVERDPFASDEPGHTVGHLSPRMDELWFTKPTRPTTTRGRSVTPPPAIASAPIGDRFADGWFK